MLKMAVVPPRYPKANHIILWINVHFGYVEADIFFYLLLFYRCRDVYFFSIIFCLSAYRTLILIWHEQLVVKL